MSRATTPDAELDFAAVSVVASSSATSTDHRMLRLVSSGVSAVAALLAVSFSRPTPSSLFSTVSTFNAGERKGVRLPFGLLKDGWFVSYWLRTIQVSKQGAVLEELRREAADAEERRKAPHGELMGMKGTLL